jgi:DNA-binding CsgD family transcriptional regulator
MTTRHSGMTARVMRQVLDVVDPAAHTGDGEYVPWSMLHALAAVIGCDEASFQVMNAWHRQVSVQAITEEADVARSAAHPPTPALAAAAAAEEEAHQALFWRGFWASACSCPQRTGDYVTVTRLSDFYTPRELAKTDIGAFLARAGTLHEILLPLPPDGEQDRRVLLFRGPGADFTDRDVLLLTLLRPHVYALLFQRQQRRRRGEPDLTPRQLEILKLVAVGCTNAQIARALFVSEATVGKHLENIYTRLGVTNRIAAVSAIDTLNTPTSLTHPADQHTA